MSVFEIIAKDPWPDGVPCSAMGEECPQEANVELIVRIHGVIVGQDLMLCVDHLQEVIAELSVGRFDEVDDIGGFTTPHRGPVCDACNGTGQWVDYPAVPCPKCHGCQNCARKGGTE